MVPFLSTGLSGVFRAFDVNVIYCLIRQVWPRYPRMTRYGTFELTVGQDELVITSNLNVKSGQHTVDAHSGTGSSTAVVKVARRSSFLRFVVTRERPTPSAEPRRLD